MNAELPHQIIAERLAAYLGPNTAQVAVRTFAGRACGCLPHELTRNDVPRLVEALRPMLRTLLGGDGAEELLQRVSEDFR
ncbi:MAG TPA: hypothetical protein VMU15_07245 [Anaeromyxobacter sp.]|nr:hypothetical protein [Anaeromyxobacter sp.]